MLAFKKLKIAAFIALAATFQACITGKITTTTYGKADGKVEWIILQLNDVYEIGSIENGKAGGLARVATIRQQLLKENPNTYTIMAGDFLNPSLIGTLKYEGKGIKGRQMVETMNAMGMDYVCFGNHEFDLDMPDLQSRINESKFEWISTNAFQRANAQATESKHFARGGGEPTNGDFQEYKILTIKDGAANESVKVGFYGIVLDANRKDYVTYTDVMEATKSVIDNHLRTESDVQMGITHVAVETDKAIAEQNPSIALIMGGHEHNNQTHRVGNTVITKADANAKTVWVHRCRYDLASKKTTISSTLVPINDQIADEPQTAAVVAKWEKIADDAFAKAGFEPRAVVATLEEALDGREATIRLQQANLGKKIAQSLALAAKKTVDCAFFNSGSVRIDDQVKGNVTQADVIRIMPFGGKVVELDIKGSELFKVLTVGLRNRGRGGYLQWYNIGFTEATKSFIINGIALENDKTYHIATTDFLLTGKEANLEFFTAQNTAISNIETAKDGDLNDPRSDVRRAFIAFLKRPAK